MKLQVIKKIQSGRDSQGHVSVRHRGGEHKRYLRLIDWRRSFLDVKATVTAIEYDPNRTARIALLTYTNGSKSYILAPANLKVGDIISSSTKTSIIKEGNRLPLKNIPVGIPINCLESSPGSGAKLVKSAGTAAFLQSVEGNKAIVKLPSGEIKIFSAQVQATIGQIGNEIHSTQKLRKAGDSRHRGVRPSVRGVAQHPDSHPHGGGEGRSSVGMNPKTPWGRPAMGKVTRKAKKSSNRLIVKRRPKKRRSK